MLKFRSLVLVAMATAISGASFAQKKQTVLPYQNAELSAEQRADDLLRRLTLEEKVSLMMHQSPAIDRLGIPSFQWWNEALHGVGRNGKATVFPITMAMAASFDEALLREVYTAVSDEARAKNQQAKERGRVGQYQSLSFWTPNINIFRDPRWGRGQETYGEDSFLTARMGVAVVQGLQGPDDAPYRKTLACAKHYAVHSGPEWNRHSFNVTDLPLRDLWETYMPAFKALVQEGNVEEVMCAYQRIDNEPCCGNTRYLKQILRDELGFKGLVTSDCWAISDFWKKNNHGVVETAGEASAMAVRAGTDLECGSDYNSLPDAVKRGLVTEKEINESLRRLLIARIKLGDFDDDEKVEWTKIPQSTICSPEHRALALRMAEEGIVLLQNRADLLPLSQTDGRKIVVMGPNAADSTMLLGNYNGFPQYAVTILQGIQRLCPDVTFVDGARHVDNPTPNTRRQLDQVNLNANPFGAGDAINLDANPAARESMRRRQTPARQIPDEELLAKADEAEIVVFVGGISPRLEGEEMRVNYDGFRGGDRISIELPMAQRRLLKALHERGKRIVFVNCSGSAVALTPETEYCDAIIQAWYGGEEGGTALANVLFGKTNPSGKLPVTFYRSTEQLPDFEDYTMQGRTYRFMHESPLFPFGHGLSYTSFQVSNVRYANDQLTLTLANTGKRDGTETVQVYLHKTDDAERPQKTLRAYQRVTVPAGQSRQVTISLPRDRFEWWDATSNSMRILPGAYELMVGTSSDADACQKIVVQLPAAS